MSNFVDDGSNYDKRGFSMAATCSPTCLPVSPDYRILKSFRPRAFKRLVENSLRVSTSAAHGKIILLSPLPPPLFPRVITLNLNLSPAFVRENYGPFSPNANEPLPPPPPAPQPPWKGSSSKERCLFTTVTQSWKSHFSSLPLLPPPFPRRDTTGEEKSFDFHDRWKLDNLGGDAHTCESCIKRNGEREREERGEKWKIRCEKRNECIISIIRVRGENAFAEGHVRNSV